MKKKILIAALILSVGFFNPAMLKNVLAVDYNKENSELRNQNSIDKEEIKAKKDSIAAKKEENINALKTVQEIGEKLSLLSQKISDAKLKLNKLTEDLKVSEQKLDTAKKREAKSREEMMLRIQYMYENSNTNLLVLFFQLDSFADFLNSAEYQSQITDFDRKQLNEYLKILDEIKTETDKHKKLVEEQTTVTKTLEKDKEDSSKLLEKQKQLIKNNKEAIISMNEEIEKLNKEIEDREAVIKENIRKAQRNRANSNSSSGRSSVGNVSNNTPSASGYIWPLPSQYTSISSPFAEFRDIAPGEYSRGGHRGVDIIAPIGTPIYSARSGVVVYSDNSGGAAGIMVCVLQDDGYLSRYMHMSATAIDLNANVSQGQVIGYVGMTGFTTGPHLHFQVESDPNASWGTTAFDPLTLY